MAKKELLQENILDEKTLAEISAGWTSKPTNVGPAVPYKNVRENTKYYYNYKGGGNDSWLIVYVLRKYEKRKILWIKEWFAEVRYESGLTGTLSLETNNMYIIR